MAHIFKHPNKSNKGIIIFTHKEMYLLNFKINRRLLRNMFTYLKMNFVFKRKISKVKKKYFIGIHWGGYAENQKTPSWVDFHLTTPGTATFVDNPTIYPLSSAYFTPIVMRKEPNVDKYWDIICVAKNDNKKRYPELLKSIRKLYDIDNSIKVLFIIASNKPEPARAFYNNILNDYNKTFTGEERESFTIIKSHPETGFQGFSSSLISYFLNRSKIFTIFSQHEGHCKAAREAQLCGLPVVVKSDVKGGMKDFLNEENSLFFDDYENAHLTLKNAIDNYDKFNIDTDQWSEILREDYSIKRLKKCFTNLYKSKDLIFDGKLINTDNLNRRLPAHYYDTASVPWASNSKFRFITTDIINSKMLNQFFSELKL